MIDISPVVQAIIALVGAVVTVFLIPYIKNRSSVEKLLLDKEKLAELETWVSIGVAAAQQVYKNIQIDNKGEAKKDYVKAFLAEQGFTFNSASINDSLNVMIEAAVYELKN